MGIIDPIVSLAFSIQSKKGVFALLLGSGISRSTGIPTGWEITLDLIRKIADMLGEDCKQKPADWYKNKFKADPDYSKLLDEISKTPAERCNLLRKYFEPTEEDRENGHKLPTKAHRAIAELVAHGYIKVIITTNFDRLIEHALEEKGIQPTVISTPDAIAGALPISHPGCTIIKVNGDYRDTRIKNTSAELENYDPGLNKLLDQVFDEFGLIVCGWSGDWDVALRAAFERCSNHRFTTYWAAHGDIGDTAFRLVSLRRAETIKIDNADSFFNDLVEKVFSLQEMDKPHPLSSKIAVTTLKRYLENNSFPIRAHDLVTDETEKLVSELTEEKFSVSGRIDTGAYFQRMKKYEVKVEILQALMVTGCYWGGPEKGQLWVDCVQRIAKSHQATKGGYKALIHLRLYPALLLFYSGGIACLKAKKYETLLSLFHGARMEDHEGHKNQPASLVLNAIDIIDFDTIKGLPQFKPYPTPSSDHLFNALREPLRPVIADEEAYENIFDIFEYLLALDYRHLADEKQIVGLNWVPAGRFLWNNIRYPNRWRVVEYVEHELEKQGADWGPLKAGFFDGSVEKIREIKRRADGFIQELRNRTAIY